MQKNIVTQLRMHYILLGLVAFEIFFSRFKGSVLLFVRDGLLYVAVMVLAAFILKKAYPFKKGIQIIFGLHAMLLAMMIILEIMIVVGGFGNNPLYFFNQVKLLLMLPISFVAGCVDLLKTLADQSSVWAVRPITEQDILQQESMRQSPVKQNNYIGAIQSMTPEACFASIPIRKDHIGAPTRQQSLTLGIVGQSRSENTTTPKTTTEEVVNAKGQVTSVTADMLDTDY